MHISLSVATCCCLDLELIHLALYLNLNATKIQQMLRRIWQQLWGTPPKPFPKRRGSKNEGEILPISAAEKHTEEETLSHSDSNSDAAEAWFNQGNQQYKAGDFLGAVASFDKALEIKPDFHEAWNNRGMALGNLGQDEQAIASFDQAVQINPDSHEAWNNRGIALRNLGQYEQAIASFDQAVQIQPDFHQAWYNRGVVLGNLGQDEQAIASYDQAVQINPDSHEAWYNRGVVLVNLGQDEQAIASFDQAVQIQPDFHQAWYNRGVVLVNLGQDEQAIASFDQAVQIQPDFHQAWYNRGVVLVNLGQDEQAIASYDQAVQINPDSHEAWYNRGVVLVNLGQDEQAIASFDQAVQIQPDFHQAWYNRGVVLGNLGQDEQAIASFDQAVQINPDSHEAWYNRGVVLGNLGQDEQAIASFDQAVQINPDSHEAWYNRGVVLGNLGQYEQAIASFDQAVQINPDSHEAWYNRGVVLGNLGQYEQAIASYDKALQIKPDFHLAWYGRGVAAGQSRNYLPLAALILRSQFPKSPVITPNPTLNQRGYEGELLSLREGLKHCPQPQSQGFLHQAIGKTHYLQGKGKRNYREYCYKAIKSYDEALKFLTEDGELGQLYLEVLQNYIKPLFDLGEKAKALTLTQRGSDLLRRLLSELHRSDFSKKQLTFQFINFQELTVYLYVQSGELIKALEVAEANKNACLSWLLSNYSEEIDSPNYNEIQQLLNPTTAIIYWHLSPKALTTFIIKPGAAEPIVIEEPLPPSNQLTPACQRLQNLETWVKNWDEQYQDYRSQKKIDPSQQGLESGENELQQNWRDNLPEMLDNLKTILNIPAILAELTNINQLILIPHRDLHRFPIHALFPHTFTITYLPSAKLGLTTANSPLTANINLLSVEYPDSIGFDQLPYAEIEATAITQLFHNTSEQISGNKATATAVKDALAANYNIFHFTGHGSHNFDDPKQSALFLSGQDLITFLEITEILGNSYQLVTLAACETALIGNQTITNEFVGLVSAFLYRQTADVVSTLWTIPEEASSLLMIYFYWQLKKGKHPILALKKAINWLRNLTDKKLERLYELIFAKLPPNEQPLRPLLRNKLWEIRQKSLSAKRQKKFDHPYYWAAFTITGKINSKSS